MLDVAIENIQPLRGPCPNPRMHCHLTGTVPDSSKGHSIVLSIQLLQDGGQNGKNSEFHEHGSSDTIHLL